MENKTIILKQTSPVLNVAAFIIIIAGLMYAKSFINLLLMAVFLSIICAQPLAWLARKKVSHGMSIAIVIIGVNLILIILGQLIGRSIGKFTMDAPKYADQLNEMAIAAFQSLNDLGLDISTEHLETMFDMGQVMNVTAGLLGDLGGIMGNTLIIMFTVVFILLELNSFAVKTIAIIDSPDKSLNYFAEIGNSIRNYLGIKTIVSLFTGFFIWVGLTIIGVEYSVLWALIAFLLNFIPNIGSFIAMVPTVLFALVQLGLGGAVGTLVTYLFVNTIMGSIVEPRVLGKGMGLSTLVVFVSLIFWGFVLGTVGMFLSVPLTMAVKIILEQNEKTKWVAIMLGTRHDAEVVIEQRKYKENGELPGMDT